MRDVAEALVRHWGLSAPILEPLGGGMNSETWLVRDGKAAYVAKRVGRDGVEDLRRGCVIATLLELTGISTGRPVLTLTGLAVAPEARLALLRWVAGDELDGEQPDQQRRIAETLAAVHGRGGPAIGPGSTGFLEQIHPEAPGVPDYPWLAAATERARRETDQLVGTWSILHTDPAPGAFLAGPGSESTALIDWAGACRGPVLYDVASAVMYLGGPDAAGDFLQAYRAAGALRPEEWRHLDAFRRLRWAVQGVYFAGRIHDRDLTGVRSPVDNERGLSNAHDALADLG